MNSNIRCIEMSKQRIWICTDLPLNSNIRCIEMEQQEDNDMGIYVE